MNDDWRIKTQHVLDGWKEKKFLKKYNFGPSKWNEWLPGL